MENQLVRTDKFLYKVKRFFRLMFNKNNSQINSGPIEEIVDATQELNKILSCKTEEQKREIKHQLASKILKNEMPIKFLADTELEDMIDYFTEDIKLKSEELENLKKEILELKKNSAE